ncbi:rho-related protein racC-like [Macrobrachium rosenbergii]|uniref:rho-related protein racC-like n=1 Tax=Macrobrachium rosenbergii TaxID=79674 RepID=UPI0034D75BCE
MAAESESQTIKVVIVGDGATGKTCLLLSYLNRVYPSEYVPTVFENHVGCFSDGENDNHISFWDTAGQHEYGKLRPLAYQDTTVFLVCFSVDNRASFSSVSSHWLPEVRKFCGLEVPTVLVGTKTDLRVDSRGKGKNQKNDTEYVTAEEGMAFAKSEKMFTYVECSALLSSGCDAAIKAAVEAGRNYDAPAKKNSCCTIS